MRVKTRKKPAARQGRRPGSVMIMVVTLLVLLALMGTAYVSMVRSDRGSSVQHVENTQVDMLIQGAVSVLQGTLANDLFDSDTNTYRAAASLNSGRYDDYDSPAPSQTVDPNAPAGVNWLKVRDDNFLADRTPLFDITSNSYYWQWISGPLKQASFEDPISGTVYHWINNTTPTMHRGEADWGATSGTTFSGVYPGVITVNGVTYPAFRRFADFDKDRVPEADVIAADTDGDGIADAALSRLVDGPVNGLVWYVAHRTIDNGGALNTAVAWEDYTLVNATQRYVGNAVGNINETSNPFTAPLPLRGLSRLFPVNVDLVSMLMTPTPPPPFNSPINPYNFDIGRINSYRASTNLGVINGDDSQARLNNQPQMTGSSPYNAPIEDNGLRWAGGPGATPPPPDFTYLDKYDALWTQLGRRTTGPGRNYPNTFFSRIPVGDTLNLAAGFVVDNGLSYTTRTLLFDTLTLQNYTQALPTSPYLPGDVYTWGAVNFPEPGITAIPGITTNVNWYNRKPHFVTYNPVSTSIPVHYWHNDTNGNSQVDDVPHPDMLEYFPNFIGNWVSNPQQAYGRDYRPGDLVLYPAQPANGVYPAVYRCLQASSSNAPVTGTSPNFRVHEDWEYQPNIPRPMKANLNTAGFSELFRAYWNVMVQYDPNPPANGATPIVTARVPNSMGSAKAPMFDRSSLRSTRTAGTPVNLSYSDESMALLRAAIAAVNTMDLRDSDDDITSVDLAIGGYHVTVFGQEKQPFITEVYASSNTVADPQSVGGTANQRGYVAIELHNPYDTPINITDEWMIGIVDRRGTNGTPALTFHTMIPMPAMNIAAGGFAVLENYQEGAVVPPPSTEKGRASNRARSKITSTTTTFYVQDLWKVMRDEWNTVEPAHRSPGGELVILRPRRFDNTRTAETQMKRTRQTGYNEVGNNYELVPVDQFDFTGLDFANPAAVPPASNRPERVYYRRPNSGDGAWKFVYPGNYRPNLVADRYGADAEYDPIDPNRMGPNPADPLVQIELGEEELDPAPGFGQTDTTGTVNHPHPPIQLARHGWGPYKYPAPFNINQNKYPFGGFARLGDVLQVPFIGSYRVTTSPTPADSTLPEMDVTGRSANAFAEFNSVTMDAAMAEDGDNANDDYEHIGRFAPIRTRSLETGVSGTSGQNYDWAKDIFDYFTVFSPHDDYFPNADPKIAANTVGGETPYQSTNGATAGGTRNPPRPVHTSSSGSFDQTGDSNDGVEGLVNINTAPWRVLAAVPFTPDPVLNRDIARSIVDHRNSNGPIESLFDLNDVNVNITAGTGSGQSIPFHEIWLRERNPQASNYPASPFVHTFANTTFDEPTGFDGDFSPNTEATAQNANPYDTVRYDFEERNLMLTRVSNLLTTRSDTFTSYITIQGWRDVGTGNAKMEVQRRYVLLLDRTGVSPANRDVKTLLLPLD